MSLQELFFKHFFNNYAIFYVLEDKKIVSSVFIRFTNVLYQIGLKSIGNTNL